MKVEIVHDGETETLTDVEFADCLFNTNKLAVDGEVYDNVVQVTVMD